MSHNNFQIFECLNCYGTNKEQNFWTFLAIFKVPLELNLKKNYLFHHNLKKVLSFDIIMERTRIKFLNIFDHLGQNRDIKLP